MIVVPRSFRAQPRWWHDDDGRAWLDRLPVLVAQQCERWRLRIDGPPFHGSNALVVPVLRGSVRTALRMAPPGDDVADLAHALTLWAGHGMVALLDADVPRRALLLERLDGGTTLATRPLAEAIPVLARLVRTLAVPVPPGTPGTDAIARELADSIVAACAALGDPVPAAQLARVVVAASERAAADPGDLATNGDLHFEQVLRGSRAPWLAVDPVLLRGDPEYDLGRVLWSRLDELTTDVELRAAFTTFVEIAQAPEQRAREWVLVRAASYLVWGLRHGLTEDPPRCLRLIAAFA